MLFIPDDTEVKQMNGTMDNAALLEIVKILLKRMMIGLFVELVGR